MENIEKYRNKLLEIPFRPPQNILFWSFSFVQAHINTQTFGFFVFFSSDIPKVTQIATVETRMEAGIMVSGLSTTILLKR